MKINIGMRHKITLAVFLSSLLIMVATVLSFSFLAVNSQRKAIEDSDRQDAQLLAAHISDSINNGIKHIITYSNSPLWKKPIVDSNSKYPSTEESALQIYFKDMDNIWKASKPDSLLMKGYLENYVSSSLVGFDRDDEDIADILITDRFGGLVAASYKPANFYQGDQMWWQGAYNDGKGGIFTGRVEYDEPDKIWNLPASAAILDQEQNLIGICRANISIDRCLAFLEDFKLDSAPRAVLVDDKGDIIYKSGVEPLSEKFINQAKGIESSVLLESGVAWKVYVMPDAKRGSAPINRLLIPLAISCALFIIITTSLGYVFSGILVRPIEELRCKHSGLAKAKDELEKASAALEAKLNDCVSGAAALKSRYDELAKAKAELEKASTELEAKLKSCASESTALKSKHDEIAKSKTELEKKATGLEAKLKDATDELTASKSKQDELVKVKAEFEKTKTDLEEKLKISQEELTALKSRQDDSAKAKTELEKNTVELETKLKGAVCELAASKSKLDEFIKTKGELEKAKADLEEKLKESSSQSVTLKSKQDEFLKVKTDLEKKSADLETKLKVAAGELAAFKSKQDELVKAKGELEKTKTGLNAKLKECVNELAAAQAKISGLSKELAEAKDKIAKPAPAENKDENKITPSEDAGQSSEP